MTPKVSVNIPCFNSSEFIRETLESVIFQTHRDFEVIVMDDGSTDNTGKIVNSFSDKRIKYFYKENEGLSQTRNVGIAASSGEFIAFLDHDDLWLPDKLEKELELFEKDKDTGLVFSDSYILKGKKRAKSTYFQRCSPRRGFILEDFLFESSNFIPLSTVMVRKEVFDEIGYFKERFKIGEEYELFLRIAEKHKFDFVDEPLAVYRLHEGNTSEKKDLFVKEAFDILDLWRSRRPDLFNKNEERLMKKRSDLLSEIASFHAMNSRFAEALLNFNLSLKGRRSRSVLIKKHILSIFGCTGYRIFDSLIRKRNEV